jgi:uncharacterized membrane protein
MFPTSANVGTVERIGSVLAGGSMMLYGFSRHTLTGNCLGLAGGALFWRGLTGWCQFYDALGISSAERAPQASLSPGEGFRVEETVIVGKPAHEVYRFWRQFSNLPQVFAHLKEVHETGASYSHWVARGPFDMDIEWDAEIITDRPGEIISWRSLEGADVATAGSVRFKPLASDAETEVRVVLRYSPPAGRIGAIVAQWFNALPEADIATDLQSLRTALESPVGTRSRQMEFPATPAT